jgi:hypothetical protein
LVRFDALRKPAFYAVKAIIGLLRDPGPAFAPTPVVFSVDAVRTMRYELFQKRHGTYVLAVWNAVSSWKPAHARNAAITIPVDDHVGVLIFSSSM